VIKSYLKVEKQILLDYINLLKKFFEKYKKKIKEKRVGVMISGGIDSSIIAKFVSLYFKKRIFFTLGTSSSLDFPYTKILASHLKTELKIITLEKKHLTQNLIQKTKIILEKKDIKANITNFSLALGFYFVCQKAKEEKIKFLFTGQGPDILLAGYNLYKQIPPNQLNSKIKEHLPLLEIDKLRDQSIANIFSIKLINPYLEKSSIDFCLRLNPSFKFNKINKEIYEKYILRRLGEVLGIPQKIILRHKKAFQYSTKIQKILLSTSLF